jgi:DNA-binding PadR family transcriptional regulator
MLRHLGRHHGSFGSGRHGGWKGRGRHGERGFEHGRLRFVLLKLIAEKPSHGYELIKAIEERTQGAYSPSPGAVYPTLTLLEELGYITLDASDGQRKLCQVTVAGQRFLAENQAILAELESRMAHSGGGRGDGEIAPPIVRAMENLQVALRLRLDTGGLNKEQVHAIAANLDAAATSIEQI